jgi:hypothetical protein
MKMAFDYKLVENNGVHCVYEVPTEQTVKTFLDQKEAKKFMRHLNLGGGFSGWTPSFFLRTIEVNKTPG